MNKGFLSVSIPLLVTLCLMAGCSGPQYEASMPMEAPSMATDMEMGKMAGASVAGEALTFGAQRGIAQAPSPEQTAGADLTALSASQPDRYLIKNARLTIETEDARKTADQLAAIVVAAGGYTSDLRQHQDALGARTVSLQVRMPADRLDEIMGQVEPLGKILDKQVTAEDVTEQFIDTEAKTRNLKKTEERLLDHLNRSAKLEDILAAEREITRINAEIASLSPDDPARVLLASERASLRLEITMLRAERALYRY